MIPQTRISNQGSMSHSTSTSIMLHLSNVFNRKIIHLCVHNLKAFNVDCASWKINSGILIVRVKVLQCVTHENSE